jgi:predicted RND superfamily exporter protein
MQVTRQDEMPVVRDPRDFDATAGSTLERLIFNFRAPILIGCLIVSALLAVRATRLRANASFESGLPMSQPFIQNYLENKDAMRTLGNAVRIAVENKQGDIYDPEYLKALQAINDQVFLMPGVDRTYMKSLWTPVVRWTQVTEEGFSGGPVMPDDFDGSPRAIERLKLNVARANLTGTIVSTDQRSSMIVIPLIETDPSTGQPLDYGAFSRELETKVRSAQSEKIGIHIVGFAKLVGDLIDGIGRMAIFFAIATVIAGINIFLYTRCVRSTLLIGICSFTAVVWQLGAIHLLGYTLDPYSALVPFLVFAVGVSHGAQKMNGIAQDIGRGTHRYVAARYTFRRLFVAGLTALIADAVGFAVLMVIDIPVIRGLALTASIGVAALIFTNLILLPILLSYVGVSPKAAQRSQAAEQRFKAGEGTFRILERFTERRWAIAALAVAGGLFLVGVVVSQRVQVGDVDPGAPELRVDSRYNQDNAFIAKNFGLSSDVLAVMVKTQPGGLSTFEPLIEMDRLEQRIRQIPGVQTTLSAASAVRFIMAASFEGSPKWMTINRDAAVSNPAVNGVRTGLPELMDRDRSIGPVIAYLADHKAETLERTVHAVEEFAATHSSDEHEILLAAGPAGIEAATNLEVRVANRGMVLMVYLAVIILCFITFRSWRAVIVAIVPLALTSVLCEALMAVLGIGIKVATLPVIALGVGIGVDYALYLVSVQLGEQRAGVPLGQAYRLALSFVGNVVALVGVTLAIGVVTWAWSPIKFQADMGILLTFMFVWNMFGALILIPALSRFLLPTSAIATQAGLPSDPGLVA